MDSSFEDWLQPMTASEGFDDGTSVGWLMDAAAGSGNGEDSRTSSSSALREDGGAEAATLFFEDAFGTRIGDEDTLELPDQDIKFETDEINGRHSDLERFFKQGSSGLDTFLTNVPIKAEQEADVFTFRWDGDEELKLNGSDTEDAASSLLLETVNDDTHASHLLLNSDLLSFDELTIHSTATTPSLLPASPSSPGPMLAPAPMSSPSLSPQSTDTKGSSNPSSPTPSSSPLPSSPSSLLPVAPGVVFLQPQLLLQQQQNSMSYASCGVVPHLIAAPMTTAATVHTPPTTPALVVQSAPTTPSSSPHVPRTRRDSKTSGSAAKKTSSATPPRPRRRRAASTTVAREKQDRMEKDLANDDKAKAILSGPLTLEKLASLSTLKVSVLQKQLRMVNASTKGSKAQLIQRLVRYMYLFSQQHRHQPHHHNSLCLATCTVQPTGKSTAGNRCNGPFIDPTLINTECNHVPVRVKAERGTKRSHTHRDGPAPEGPSVLSSSAPATSFASFLSTHVFPSPLQITLTGRIVEEEEEEEFSD